MFFTTRHTRSPLFPSSSLTSLMLSTFVRSRPSMPNPPARSSRLAPMNASRPTSFRITDEMVPFPPRILPYISIHLAYFLLPIRQYPIHRASNSAHTASPSLHSSTACSHRLVGASGSYATGRMAVSNHRAGRSMVSNVLTLTSRSRNATVSPTGNRSSGWSSHSGTSSASIRTSASSARTTPSTFCLSGLYRTSTRPFCVGFSYIASSSTSHTRSRMRSSSNTRHVPDSHAHQSFFQRHRPLMPPGAVNWR